MQGDGMKSTPSKMGSSTEAGQKALSQFTTVDELLIRPSADQSDLVGQETKQAPRISLERFQELEQCIRNSPADPEPYEELANIYYSQQRWKDARRVLDQGVAHNPNYEPMMVLREEAMLQSSKQELEYAQKQLRNSKSPENEQYLQRCELDIANLRLAVCEARLARHPEQKDLYVSCGIALRQLGRIDEAIVRLEKASNDPAMRARACLQLGFCYQQLGKVVEALGAFRKAAFYRAPPPTPEIKQRALEIAAELSEEAGLIQSAILYNQLLLEISPKSEIIKAKIASLQAMPI